jgi:glycosyltransferase involved in cell wall biosynthesis
MTKNVNHIYIDAQVFQTAAWHRGMGKYSLVLLMDVIPLAKKNDRLTLLFNANLTIPDAIQEYLKSLKNVEFAHLNLAVPKEPRDEFNIQPVRLKNKQILNEYFNQTNVSSPTFFILALYLDEVCSVFPDGDGKKLLVYYDSIPYLYHERYGQFKGFFDHFFLPHTATVYEATTLLSISNTVANDLKIFFGVPDRKISNIDGASIPKPKVVSVKPSSMEGINQFILMPSGQELRKNNARAMRAFRSFVNTTKQDIKLVVTSFFTDEARMQLEEESGGNVIFTGNVSSEELAWLYENSQFILFPSEYEGLGLPVLEAVDENKLVVCSDISVFREISPDAFIYFDPLDEESIKNALITATKGDNLPDISSKYAAIKNHYKWSRSARLTYEAFDRKIENQVVKKKKIAILCPDPSGFSAIGKVVAESHSVYSDYFDIDYYFDKGPGHRVVRPNLISYVSEACTAAEFDAEKYDTYDAVVYHIGNSEYHLEIIRSALTLPGYAILHDTYLDGLYLNLREADYISPKRLKLEEDIDKSIANSSNLTQLKSSKLASLVTEQKAVIVHSHYAHDAVNQLFIHEKSRAVKLNLPVDTNSVIADMAHRSEADYKPTIALAGIIAGVKGINIIESLAQDPRFSHCLVKVFGFSFAEPEEIQRLALMPNVEVSSNPSDFEFQRNMSKVDILVNVRQHYKGETSLTTLEAMRYGAAVIVKKVGWYDELPSDIVIKVQDNDEVELAVEKLINSPSDLNEISRKAIELVRDSYSHDQYASGMFDTINKYQ